MKKYSSDSQRDYIALRSALWPECSGENHREDIANLLRQPDRSAQFIAYDRHRTAVGFLEARMRQDYVNGTETSPVVFVEGLYTVPSMRRKGVAAALMKEAEKWTREKGCSEIASDALIDNQISHKTHKSLGFEETERVVYFRKVL